MNAPTLNPIGLQGIEFVELCGQPEVLAQILRDFGFSKSLRQVAHQVDLWRQHDIQFLVNHAQQSFAAGFRADHGPCIPSMGWRVADARRAVEVAVARGAKAAERVDYFFKDGKPVPAIYGIGGSIIYFIDDKSPPEQRYAALGFSAHPSPDLRPDKGFLAIDHLTNNVPYGAMQQWSDFYKQVFGFVEVRYFDIRGAKTGLMSHALRSPCGTFSIPINEAKDEKSQINEYLREYRGPGVQHLAFLTNDIIASLEAMRGSSISTLTIDFDYYDSIFNRVPNVVEDHAALIRNGILVDGDDDGYLLQVFTKNLIGPIFIEIIQRHNHQAFGEGNFGALFRSIERDQEMRGVL